MDAQLLDQIALNHAAMSALVEQIPAEIAVQPQLLGHWSAHALLAHLIGWQATAIEVLCAVRDQTTAPDPDDEDEFNAASVAARHNLTWTELQQAFATTNATLLATARSLTARQWEDPRVAGWLQGSTINHYQIHQQDFQRVLA